MSAERTGTGERALIAHVRHEIRTPISAIVSFAELLIEDAEAGGRGQAILDLQRIRACGQELLEILERVLDPARLATGRDLDWESLGAEVHFALRTPIDSVLAYCDLLVEEADGHTEEFVADVRNVEKAARRLFELIEDVVLLARQEPGALPQTAQASVASAEIREAVRSVAKAVHPAGDGAVAGQIAHGLVLVADDNEVDRGLLRRRLERAGYQVLEAADGQKALDCLRDSSPDLALLDVLMPGLDGLQVLERIKANPATARLPVLMLSSWNEAQSVARCLEVGAEDYLAKPVNSAVLFARISGCLDRKRRWDREVAQLRHLEDERGQRYGELLGKTQPAGELRRQIERLACTPEAALLQGERGTGKELAARLIHRKDRPATPFLAIDCARAAQANLEERLFAPGRSDSDASSYLELVAGGTLLLKNVEALNPGMQSRLARFFELGTPGGVRLIATCRQKVADLVASGTIQADLASALAGRVLAVPPLRERKRDIPELAGHFLRRHAERTGRGAASVAFDDRALIRLVTYDFPRANVEELEEVVERALVLTEGEVVGAEAIFLGLPPSRSSPGPDLLALPARFRQAALLLFPGAIRLPAAIVFAFLIATCFVLPAGEGIHPGLFLGWAIWWPLFMLAVFTCGRIWCSVCPMGFAGELAGRLAKRGPERRVPGWIKDRDQILPVAGFGLILWIEAATDMRHSPVATGLLLLAITAGAIAFGALFPRRTWCRHVCPLGGFSGLCASAALVEVRPTPDVCAAKCKGHACYTGIDQGRVPGCPMFQHVMFQDTNQHCVLCLGCVRSCPNGSPRLNLRWPASELWTGQAARPGAATGVLVLLGLLLAQIAISWIDPAPGWPRLWVATLATSLGAAIPLGLAGLVRWQLAGKSPDVARAVWDRLMAVAPLMAAGFLGFVLADLPGIGDIVLLLGYQPPSAALREVGAVGLLPVLQVGAVAAGLAIMTGVLWKLGRPGPRREDA